ncbi:MAG: hypothetical protein KDB07_13155, partial [Planctomycetes bacterium]|nr:hypothetical protein [Planctomycetota bacterium]
RSQWWFTWDMQRNLDKMEFWDFNQSFEYRDRAESLVKEIFDRSILRLEELGIRFHHGKVIRTNNDVTDETLALLAEFSNIGHKVDCFYGSSAKKVDPIPPGFQEMLLQQSYSFIYSSGQPRSKSWVLAQDLFIGSGASSRRSRRSGALPSRDTGSIKKDSGKIVDAEGEIKKDTGAFDNALTDFLEGKETTQVDKEDDSSVIDEVDDAPPESRKQIMVGKSIFHIGAWIAANRLTKANTDVLVSVDGNRKPTGEVRRVIMRLANFFKHKLYEDKLPEATFKEPPKPHKYYISFDFLSHPQLKIQSRVFRRSKTTKVDEAKASQIQTMSILVQDTYGVIENYEVPTSWYTPAMLMGRLLRDLIEVPTAELQQRIEFHSAGTPFHRDFVKAFETVLARAHMEFRSNPPKAGQDLRFLTLIEERYYVITRRDDGTWDAESLQNERMLYSYLEQPLERPTRTIVDPGADGVDRLRAIFSRYVAGLIQVYVIKRAGEANAMLQVLDECGSLFS